jgi:hypothetical protein
MDVREKVVALRQTWRESACKKSVANINERIANRFNVYASEDGVRVKVHVVREERVVGETRFEATQDSKRFFRLGQRVGDKIIGSQSHNGKTRLFCFTIVE